MKSLCFSLPARRVTKGFTLIELLVVIGIIATLVGVLVGVLGGGSNSTTALQSAQGTLSSLLSAARGQAALKGGTAALFVNNNPGNTDRYLRYCVIATTPDSPVVAGSVWTVVNDGYYLPTGIYVLPTTPPAGNDIEAGVNFGTLCSNGFDGSMTGLKFNSNTGETWLALGINSLGTRVNATGGGAGAVGTNIILSIATIQPPGTVPAIKFSNAKNIRGLSVSQYGVAALINDAGGFN